MNARLEWKGLVQPKVEFWTSGRAVGTWRLMGQASQCVVFRVSTNVSRDSTWGLQALTQVPCTQSSGGCSGSRNVLSTPSEVAWRGRAREIVGWIGG